MELTLPWSCNITISTTSPKNTQLRTSQMGPKHFLSLLFNFSLTWKRKNKKGCPGPVVSKSKNIISVKSNIYIFMHHVDKMGKPYPPQFLERENKCNQFRKIDSNCVYFVMKMYIFSLLAQIKRLFAFYTKNNLLGIFAEFLTFVPRRQVMEIVWNNYKPFGHILAKFR